MANLHNEFRIFHDHITLTAGMKAALGIARNSIRECIIRYFSEILEVRAPKFLSLGDYAADTMVNPIEGECRIEDGVHLRHLDKQDRRKWPAPDMVHQWLMDATRGHPLEKPVDTPLYVRVRCAGQYCVDLPCYAYCNGQFMQAVKGGIDWTTSDHLVLTEWIKSSLSMHGEQLRRVVRYFNAWSDFQSTRHDKLANGQILAILAISNYKDDPRDDRALARTLEAVSNHVREIVYVLNPVNATENLTARWPESQKAHLRHLVQIAGNTANAAIIMQDDHDAARLWRKLLGDRFPVG